MTGMEEMITPFCNANRGSTRLPYNMPEGYETAYGTYDVTVDTLFLNRNAFQHAPEYEALPGVKKVAAATFLNWEFCIFSLLAKGDGGCRLRRGRSAGNAEARR